jgi:lactoylglutathione lyase
MEYLHTMVRISDVEKSLDFYCNGLPILGRRPQQDLVDIHIRRLIDGIGDGAGDGVRVDGHLVGLVHRLRHHRIADTGGQLADDAAEALQCRLRQPLNVSAAGHAGDAISRGRPQPYFKY